MDIVTAYSRVKRRIDKRICDIAFTRALHTPAMPCKESNDVIVFSMMGKAVIAPYIVAVKSFLYWFKPVSVQVLSDGSLDADDIRLLEQHIPNIKVTDISEVDTGGLPTGSCWERLIKLIELTEHAYVIQLDSDIVANGPMPEILQAIEDKHSFVIGSPEWQEPVPVSYLSELAKKWPYKHVQTYTEQVMSSAPMFQENDVRFLRGCAGFSGFPKGTVNKKDLELFSNQMEQAVGREIWYNWGSEQVASNYLASICPGAHVLPWPKYQTYKHPLPMGPVTNASLVHYMGTNRYDDGAYRKMGLKAIDRLINMPVQG